MHAEDLQRTIDASPVHRGLRLRVTRSGPADITLEAEPRPEHAGEEGGRYLHGGVVATVLDTAATFALIQSTGTDWNTVDLRIDFLRPAPVGLLVAAATAVHVGRRLGRATAELTEPSSGRLLATAAGTFARAVAESE
jgi:uncharacterized protein (TIGR00369 family)